VPLLARAGYVEPARRAGLPRAADYGAHSDDGEREARRSAGTALGAKDGVALASAVTARHVCGARAARQRRSHRTRRAHRVLALDPSAGKNAPLGKKREREEVAFTLATATAERVREFEKALLDEARLRHKDLLDDIASKKELSDDIVNRLKRMMGDFTAQFRK